MLLAEGVVKRGEKSRPADVRAALVEAAAALIEELPESQVSLRAVARRAGVSHSAPAHYFPSRADLMAAGLAEGFDALTARMLAGRDAAGEDPWDRLKAIGLGYIAFALERPRTYTMMFQPGYINGPDSVMARAGVRSRDVLTLAVAETHRPDSVDQGLGVAFAWMNVHGFVSLLTSGMLDFGPVEGMNPTPEVADRLLSLMRPAYERE
jgi:AcrR family transcriptional regulator